MRRTILLLSVAVLLMALTVACEKSEDVTGAGGNGTTDTPKPDDLALASSFRPVLANGMDTLAVRATIVDEKGRGIGNVGVSFSTTHGRIQSYATTNDKGVAIAVLTAAASRTDIVASVRAEVPAGKTGAPLHERTLLLITRAPLSADLMARAASERFAPGGQSIALPAGNLRDEVSILMRGVSIALGAEPSAIPADGITDSHLIATLMETTRRVPLEGEEVRFGTTAGRVTGKINTDATGNAWATLTAQPGDTEATVTAYYGADLTAQVRVPFQQLTLSLSAASAALIADGISSTSLLARLTVTELGTPVAGARIDFSTTGGTITSPVTTDPTGAAVATLVSSTAAQNATVTARFGSVLEEAATVAFLEPPSTESIILAAEKTSLPADGSSETELAATALDGDGFPVPDGTLVIFSVEEGSGRVIPPAALTERGVATALYFAGTSAGSVLLKAESGVAQATLPILLTHLGVGEIELTADASSILADGVAMARITAAVRDRFGAPVAPGTVVNFETSLGVIEDVTPTDAAGLAGLRLRAIPYRTGTGRVTAQAGTVQKTIDIRFVSEGASHVEAVEVEHPRIGVRGSSDHETATIRFEVQDARGIPVDADHRATLSFAIRPLGGGTDATVWPLTATTNDRGIVTATVNAGIVSGTVEVQATSGGLLSRPVRVAIHGDLPDPEHFSVFFENVNIAGLVYAGLINGVTAKIGDQWGNPVPDSTAAWFFADYGIVQGSGFTSSLGDARVLEETAAPFPAIPGGDGLVRICAQTVGKSGDLIQTCNYVMWSGHTIVEITEPDEGFSIPNGGSVTITYRVRDANFNPLTEGTSITVTTTAGGLGGVTEFVLTDTQSDDYTTFQAVLSDPEPEVDVASDVTVTVTVKSQNGNKTTFITGTLH